MAKHFYKEESRIDWYSEEKLTPEKIAIGAQLRMADAIEKIAGSIDNVMKITIERDRLQFLYKKEQEENKRLRSQLLKLKNKLI